MKLLELISCNCKGDCSKRCDCRRSGFECTAMCGQCHGESCTNLNTVLVDDTDDDDIDNNIDQRECDDDNEKEEGDKSDDSAVENATC